MDIYCMVTPTGLVPMDAVDWEQKNKLKNGIFVRVNIKRERNIKFHRKFMSLLRITLDNISEKTQRTKKVFNLDSLITAIKRDLGEYDIEIVDDIAVIHYHSISFAKMDEDTFEVFLQKALDLVLNEYLLGTDREDILEEIELELKQSKEFTR